MSLREVTAWAQLHDVATLSDVALLKRLRNAADWFGILAAQTLAVRAAVTGCTSGKRLRLVDGTAISAPGGGSAEWRLHMGYDPHTCQFTDFELTDSRDAERLDRFAQTADEIRIADRGFGSRPECIRSLAFGEADYIVRVHWRGLRWLTAEGMRFDMMGFLRGLDCGKNGETTVMIGNSGNKKAGAPFPARLIAVSLPPEKALISKTRLLSENRRKGRVVQAETLEAAGHVLLLTSLPEDEYSAEQVADCYRLRWQIELAFKRLKSLNRPGFPGECFICELRLPDHHFRWKRNMPFPLLPAGYDPVVPATVGYCTSPPTSVWPVPLRRGFSSSYDVSPPLYKVR